MKVLNIGEYAAEAISHDSRPATALVHDSSDARIVVFRIEPGQAVPVHTSTSTVLLMIVSGSGVVIGAEGERTVQAGDIVAYDVQEPHGMLAHEEKLVIVAVIAPRPGTR